MKVLKYILLALLVTATVSEASAKRVKKSVFIFGFSASFKDSTVYFTDVQEVKDAWIDTKTKFLLGRDNYSYQLKEYFTTKQGSPNRVCMVFFDKKRKAAEKQFVKLRKKYTGKKKGGYLIQYLTEQDFKFEPVDMSPDE